VQAGLLLLVAVKQPSLIGPVAKENDIRTSQSRQKEMYQVVPLSRSLGKAHRLGFPGTSPFILSEVDYPGAG
jgi:hypothetical protein